MNYSTYSGGTRLSDSRIEVGLQQRWQRALQCALLMLAMVFFSFSGFGQITDFSGFNLGTVNYQGSGGTSVSPGGYTIPDPYGSLWTVSDEWGFMPINALDEGVVDDGSGNLVWRISNAVTQSGFSNLPYSPAAPLAAGESTAALWNDRGDNHTLPLNPPNPRAMAGTQNFHAKLRFKSATGTAQPGLSVSLSAGPKQGNIRQSFVSIADNGSTGLNIGFFDTDAVGGFISATLATDLAYTQWHEIDIYITFVDGLNNDGSGNDVVSVLLNGNLIHTGTTWETFYGLNPGSFPLSPYAVDALMFRVSGAAQPALSGAGLFFDDVTIDNAAYNPIPPIEVSRLGSLSGWYSDDTRSSTGVVLNGTVSSYQPFFNYPGAPAASTANDALIAQQINFTNPYAGANGGVMILDGTTANQGKSSVRYYGDGTGIGNLDASFTSAFRWFMDPYPTSRTVGLNLLVLGSDNLVYSLSWVGTGSTPSAWNQFSVTGNTNGWRVYNNGAPGSTGDPKTLVEWLTDATYGSILSNGLVIGQGFNIGSSQRQCRVGIDWLESSLINGGGRVNFTEFVPVPGCVHANACNYDSSADIDNGSCTYDCYGCTVTDPSAEIDDNSCALCETTQNFNGAITLAAEQTADAWYVDRWAPSAFISNATFDGGQRLRHVISEFDGAIYRGAQSSAFYNTQGRKFDLPANTQSLEIELYIPAAWETTGRRMAGLWGTGMNAADAISSYPIIEFASDGDAGPRFQVWTAAGWTPIGLPTGFAYDNWYTLQINLLESGEFLYRVGDLAFVTNNYASFATVRLDNVILQGHNTETGVDYVIHWDNLTYGSTCAGFDALSAEVVEVGGVAGYTTYRVFANFDFETDELIAVYGVNSVSEQSPLSITSTGVFYQDANGGLTANAVNPAAYAFFPSSEFDSYLALGALPQATTVQVTGIAAGDFTTAGLTINNEAGGLWYITPGSEPEAVAGANGKVLIGQFTTNGVVSMTVNLQYRGANGVTFLATQESITFGTPTEGCTDATACNYNALALVDDDSCTYPGCMDPFADNYAAAAGCPGTVSCVYTDVTAFYVNDAVLTGDVYTTAIGSDTNNGSSIAPFATITKALELATAGDTIYVDAGSYEEQIIIDKQVRLLGPNAGVSGTGTRVAEAIVQFPAGASNASPLMFVSAGMHDVTIAGFDLRCQDETIPNYHYLIGAWSQTPVNNLSIRNNRMYGAEIAVYMLAGFGANNGSGVLIEGNYINGGPNVNSIYNRGLYVGGTSGTIQDNVIENTNIGIQYMPYDNANLGFVRRNTVASSLIGLYNNYQTRGAALVTWEQNEVSVAPNPQTGLASLIDGARTTPAIFNGIYFNTFGTQGSGAAPTALFQNNTINAANPGGTTSTVFRAVTLQNSAVGATAVLENNSFTGYTEGIYINTAEATGATVTATCNWWGSNVPSIVQPFIPAGIDFVPLLVSGVDADLAMGFQPEAGACQTIIEGCTNPSACNYDAAANLNNGTCDFSCIVCAGSTPAGTNATFAAGACTDCLTVETFTSAIATGDVAAPGVWYTDRYAPSVFNGAVSFLGNNRLRHIISEFDGGQYRPSGLQGGFYDTQGRKLDMPDATNAISIELYVPASWATSQRRMAGLWGTAYNASNAISGYPIIEFTSTDGVARFRGWEGNGTWVDLGLPTGFAYNAWVTLEISLLDNGQFLYRVGDVAYATTTMTPNASVEIGNVILQGHNTFDGVTYTIHWDNFEYEHGLLGCTDITACNYNPTATCDDNSCIDAVATTVFDTAGVAPTIFSGFDDAADHMVIASDCNVSAAITALERFVGNLDPDGTNVYRILSGNSPTSAGDPTPAAGLARWNYYIQLNLGDYTFNDVNVFLDIDWDPTAGTSLYSANYAQTLRDAGFGALSTYQDAQNLGFSFWAAVGDPAILPFDPFANGQYNLTLRVATLDGVTMVSAPMIVEVYTPGCTNPVACNYNASASEDDASCVLGTLWYADADGDGFGNANVSQTACIAPAGYVANSTDCDDTNAAINPNTTWYADADNDGFGDANVSQVACVQPSGYVLNSTDCNDNNAAINPNTIWYADADGDGYGNAAATLVQCQQPLGYVAVAGDCDDNNFNVNPGVAESPCNGIDDNCNGSVDENQVLGCMDVTACNYNVAANCPDNASCTYATTWYADADGDGFGNAALSVNACTAPAGYVANNTDCDDSNDDVYPGAPGTGADIDNNCDGVVSGAEIAPCAGDFNGDGLRNATDLLMLLGNWGGSGIGDMNNDGTVNSSDQLAFLVVFATACP